MMLWHNIVAGNVNYFFMDERNNRQLSTDRNKGEDIANKGHGAQGIDKAPGEETAQDKENVVAQTQKGKNKVDGDPTQQDDQPIENE
jgi:hypothetical protein